tara:strand:- start:547 stop:1071 length:525 start_codon:yes stop_codon:yes gene_type:complete
MSWTDERVALLKKLWGEGRTAAEIAKDLGGVTRNAVIGKAHRLKLSSRVSPIQQNAKKQSAKPAQEKAKVSRSMPSPANHISAVEPVDKKSSSYSKPKNSKLYDLMDLAPRACRWPEGDPKEDNFGFCGAHCLPGLPYCEEHAQVAYQATTRNRIMKDKALIEEQAKALAGSKG